MRWKIAAVSRFPTSGAARLVSVLLIVRMHSTLAVGLVRAA
jgi:hypothetical protein